KVPLFGLLYKTGSVLVDRKSEKSRKESFTKMKEVLNMGLHMCIYHEGTRNKTNEPLKSFHDGAFKLSVESGKAILPAVIFHTKKILPAGKPFYLWPRSMEIHFLPAIPRKAGDTYLELKNEVFEIMKNHITTGY
ncbi:MAG: 1-acyl-sn-glycerol-3-phosphate acyltransferase, partial [Chitinophagaceae bacterium]|nr:1-acyl-sn-glycerol-3-phosphate acyltransferase [Chitinophagaceae bacterium]